MVAWPQSVYALPSVRRWQNASGVPKVDARRGRSGVRSDPFADRDVGGRLGRRGAGTGRVRVGAGVVMLISTVTRVSEISRPCQRGGYEPKLYGSRRRPVTRVPLLASVLAGAHPSISARLESQTSTGLVGSTYQPAGGSISVMGSKLQAGWDQRRRARRAQAANRGPKDVAALGAGASADGDSGRLPGVLPRRSGSQSGRDEGRSRCRLRSHEHRRLSATCQLWETDSASQSWSRLAYDLSVARAGRTSGTSLAVALFFVSCVVVGCGSGKSPSARVGSGAGSGASAQYVDAVKFARCMRAHDVPQFPDPRNPGGFSSAAIDALNTTSPAFRSATNTCDRLLPNEGQPTQAEFEQAVVDGVKVARCMRAHGVNFPGPGIQGSHLTLDLGNVDTSSPRFTEVGDLCQTRVYGTR